MNRVLRYAGLLVVASSTAGCSAIGPALSAALGASQAGVVAAAGSAQNFEYQKLIEVHALYDGLDHMSVAVLVDAGLDLQYQRPDLVDMISGVLYSRLDEHVPGIKLKNPMEVRNWQYTTPQWNAMPFGEMATELGVDRVVIVDLQTFRLHPRGNRWLWEGVCTAVVGVAEQDGYDPDEFVEVWEVTARFPDLEGLDKDSASEWEIQTGLLSEFGKRTSWIFYMHLEPKYPDRYNRNLDPELDL